MSTIHILGYNDGRQRCGPHSRFVPCTIVAYITFTCLCYIRFFSKPRR